ncbi:MAG: hypothetical protein ABNH29_16870 [Paracoccus sp. (in: a-proteobacteria)]|jgi:hypothetical protein|uniref:hypothetical protein n=1 Tax=Paracoccus sp. TaxID=267 RepID=UPI0032D8E2D2
MSVPRKIWVDDVSAAYPNIAFVDNGSEDVYHHDDVVRELVEALEPFARYMHTDEGRMDCDHKGAPFPDHQGVGWIYLTHGHFRRARAALAKIAQEG